MAFYRKRPVEVEAIQWNGIEDNAKLQAFAGHWVNFYFPNVPIITTSEGSMTVAPGDWVIRGTHGEYYPCKPDVFATVYDEVK